MKLLFMSFLFLLFSAAPAFAQHALPGDTPSPTPVPEVEYLLPYPGLLPDNPLYPLKTLRDRVISLFISDPVKKAEFDLLQADKRLQAGLFLLQKDKPDVPLAVTTISKAQNYYEQSLTGISQRMLEKSADENAYALFGRLTTAARKHQQMITKNRQTIMTHEPDGYMMLLRRADGYVRTTEELQKTYVHEASSKM